MNINNIVNKVNTVINTKKVKKELYNQSVASSSVFTLTDTLNFNETNVVVGNYKSFMNLCPYLTSEDAKKIDGFIPIQETVLNIYIATQLLNNLDFIIILTNLRMLVIDPKSSTYHSYNYQDITSFNQLTKGLITQTIILNNIVLKLDINQEDLNIFYSIVTSQQYRNAFIASKTKYLCGIIPNIQLINEIQSGITIDKFNNIVFHNRKIDNYLCKYEDIINYEVLEDNTPVLRRKTNTPSNKLTSSKQDCMEISIRITLNNGKSFKIIILEPTTFNNPYSHTNKTYLKSYEFAKSIIEVLDSLNHNLYY